jgi:hypothetical protein
LKTTPSTESTRVSQATGLGSDDVRPDTRATRPGVRGYLRLAS